MKGEAWVFTGVALFFGATTAVYGWFAHEPAGIAALCVSFVMSSLVAAFLWRQYRRGGERPEDRKTSEVRDAAGRRTYFPARSYFPVLAAAGSALVGLGVVEGLWLCLIGFGVLLPGILGFAFQNLGHPE
ncbi:MULTISPECIES: cytochrome c oxidase subunit 4 [unclassified Streptomyces]|uniref:aa3-type cytochrome oxidase subunit IV n=1 Tax=unclassified Streptomyces TaxID=2593676 RepID=UPI001BECB29E|nr:MULTISPECIES: cytochrome c oxidase subunit 4 [unclassified Streptomyces]MBT2408093.1 cytochrome c oxidase subunit 4 [Streptomyces sp. ISL-21]MBT2455793.1 cytochrome c oxidase subunit 4 [Streptomyces sp. ISL-86]MBT2609543.1 cytochrome c oxidase subunit 4 [Streptomyces sp. ISL-87]